MCASKFSDQRGGDNLYLCPNSFECQPVQEQIDNLMKTFPNVNIKTPLFKLHANFYGTDNLSAFSVNITNFLSDWNLKYKESNDTFSFLYINRENLITFSDINTKSKQLCNLKPNQILSNNHFRSAVELLLSDLEFFQNLYNNNIRQKRSSSLVQEWFSNLFFSDTTDLKNIHLKFNQFLEYNNRQILIEKRLLKNINENEKSILNQVTNQEVEIWFTKLNFLQFEKIHTTTSTLSVFVNSMDRLETELSQFKQIFKIILLKNTNANVSCIAQFGCFLVKKSKILFNNDHNQIKLLIEKIDIVPQVTILATCQLINSTHIYRAHKTILSGHPDCKEIRELNSTDYFYNKKTEKVVLLIKEGYFGFSCAQSMNLEINNESYLCNKEPTKFYIELISFETELNKGNYLISPIREHQLLTHVSNNFKGLLFNLNLDLTQDELKLEYFDDTLPPIIISPTIFGMIIIVVCLCLMMIIICFALYCFNESIRTICQLYMCCCKTKGSVTKPVINTGIECEQASLKSSNESLMSNLYKMSIFTKK